LGMLRERWKAGRRGCIIGVIRMVMGSERIRVIDGVDSSPGALFVITVVVFLVVLYYYHCIHVCFCNTMIDLHCRTISPSHHHAFITAGIVSVLKGYDCISIRQQSLKVISTIDNACVSRKYTVEFHTAIRRQRWETSRSTFVMPLVHSR